MLLQDLETAWAAGLFEGEGCIQIRNREDDIGKKQVILSLKMTDEDVIQKFSRICPGHALSESKWYRANGHKPQFLWQMSRQEDVEKTLCLFMPFMGERRKEKSMEAINLIREKRIHRLEKQRENMAVARRHNWRNDKESKKSSTTQRMEEAL